MTTMAELAALDEAASDFWADAEVISTHTRAQALADGQLVAVDRHGYYKHPIAFTAALWAVVDRAVKNVSFSNDLDGVIHDILWMSKHGRELSSSRVAFQVIIKGAGRRSMFDLVMDCGPGDSGEPVMTCGFGSDF